MIAKLKDMVRSRDGKEWVVTFTTPIDIRELFDDLFDKLVEITIRRHYKKRSLDANAFAWVLINKITAELQLREPKNGWTATEVYRDAIREIGGVCSTHCIPNEEVDGFVRDWLSLGMGFQVELFPSKIEGCTNGHFWKGSHIYDTQQMTVLISNLIQQAEGLGIPTITEEQEKKMLGQWDKKRSAAQAVDK